MYLNNPKSLYNESTPHSKHVSQQKISNRKSNTKQSYEDSTNKENCKVESQSTLKDVWMQREAARSQITRSDSHST